MVGVLEEAGAAAGRASSGWPGWPGCSALAELVATALVAVGSGATVAEEQPAKTAAVDSALRAPSAVRGRSNMTRQLGFLQE